MSSEMCTVCGLPRELCICEEVAKEQQRIVIEVDTRKYKKEVTVVEGLNPTEINVQELPRRGADRRDRAPGGRADPARRAARARSLRARGRRRDPGVPLRGRCRGAARS